MKFTELSLPGAFEIDIEARGDARGLFARTFCAEEFAAQGLKTDWVQMNTSVSAQAGTLRGMHFQRPPAAEAKLVRAIRGQVLDVIVDLRAGSQTYGQHAKVVLDADRRNAIYVPEGCAHGFQTLGDDTELLYLHSAFYTPGIEGGVNARDPELGIDWPLPVSLQSDRDVALPPLRECAPQ